MAGLVLEPREVVGPARWRWLLRTEDGEPLASHQVLVPDGDYEYRGFTDLYRFLRWEADPDRRVVSEAELAARVGTWIGERLLGPEVMAALLAEAPVTVRVPVPVELGFLPYRPWEIASWRGAALGRKEIGFVYDLPDTRRRPHSAAEAERPLRMLALFSLPTGGSVLGLRRERYALQQLVKTLGEGQQARAIQLQILQYGVTRGALTTAVDDAAGWDVLHISGHGGAGLLVLEHQDGSPDPIDPDQLVDLLSPLRRRLRLAVLSACESGAATAAEMLRILQQSQSDKQQTNANAAGEGAAVGGGVVGAEAVDNVAGQGWPGVGRALVARLGCAVLAMRYPVIDDFAIALTGQLYRGMFEHGQPVDMALARALPRAALNPPSLGAPAVSLATPALLGPATGLELHPPLGQAGQRSLVMAGFPAEPARFVGRTALLTRARHALLSGSERAGVLLHGMAGAGKTTAAVELAYQTGSTFTAAAYWSAAGLPWQTALGDLAVKLEATLNPELARYGLALQLVGNTSTDNLLEAYLPRLSELIEQTRLLLVLDNLETLLTDDRNWLDPRFGRLITALNSHVGASRLLLTSRTVPINLDQVQIEVLPVHALARDEALLLARELPHLSALAHDSEPAVRASNPQVAADRSLLVRTLTVVQGHPKLLDLADASAADPAVLHYRVTAAEAAAASRGTPLAAFLSTGHTEADPDDLFDALTRWTRSTTSTLPEASQLLLQLLAAAEPDDRTSLVLNGNWADLWHHLQRPDDPPSLPAALAPLITAALIDPEPIAAPVSPDSADGSTPLAVYHLHPGIADTTRADTPPETLTTIDTELAAYWRAAFDYAIEHEQQQASGWLVVHAALAAAPYLLRLQAWGTASYLLERAMYRDGRPTEAGRALPYLEAIVEATQGTELEFAHRAKLAEAVGSLDPVQGERQLRAILDRAIQDEQYQLATSITTSLAGLLQRLGRYPDALRAVEQSVDLTRRAGLGPWTQLADAAQRLQILTNISDAQTVFDEAQQLRERMRQLPDLTDNESVDPWSVRESILGAGREAARDLGRSQDALDLNAEVLESKRQRGASPYQLARTRFNDYGPLLRLDRLSEADQLLRSCQEEFENARDLSSLGGVLSARADLADKQGYRPAAVRLEQIALRYRYAAGEPGGVSISHFNLASYQRRAEQPPGEWLPHRLAATLLSRLIGDKRLDHRLLALARELANPAAAAALPATLAEVVTVVEQVDGVSFNATLDALEPDPVKRQAALDEIINSARAIPTDHVFGVQSHLARWEPMLAAIVVAADGDRDARSQIDQFLDQGPDTPRWTALASLLRRILDGERDPDTLLPSLDPVDTAIVTRLLDALAGRIQLNTAPQMEEWLELWEPALAAILNATAGDQTAHAAADQLLDQAAENADWAALVGVLRRILDGERDPDTLLSGLDPIDTAITTRLLDALAGRVQLSQSIESAKEADPDD